MMEKIVKDRDIIIIIL